MPVNKWLYGGDPMDATMLNGIEQPRANVPNGTPMARVLRINGEVHTIQGATEDELTKNELAKMREIFGSAPAAETQQQRDDRGRFVQQPVEKVEETVAESVAERLEREMVEKALARQGVSIDTLREIEAEKQSKADVATWESAATEFRNGVGSSWAGGRTNQTTMGKVIQILGLTDQPTVSRL